MRGSDSLCNYKSIIGIYSQLQDHMMMHTWFKNTTFFTVLRSHYLLTLFWNVSADWVKLWRTETNSLPFWPNEPIQWPALGCVRGGHWATASAGHLATASAGRRALSPIYYSTRAARLRKMHWWALVRKWLKASKLQLFYWLLRRFSTLCFGFALFAQCLEVRGKKILVYTICKNYT